MIMARLFAAVLMITSFALPMLCARANSDAPSIGCCADPRVLPPRGHDGTFRTAAFDSLTDAAFDSRTGDLYVSDARTNEIRLLTSDGYVSTIAGACDHEAGSAVCRRLERDGIGQSARFALPWRLALDQQHEVLYVIDVQSSALRSVRREGGQWKVATIVSKLPVDCNRIGCFVAFDPSHQTIYVGADKLFKYTPNGVLIGTVDVKVTGGIALDRDGDVYIAQFDTISRLNQDGTLTVIAGQEPKKLVFHMACLCQPKDGKRGTGVIYGVWAMSYDASSNALVINDYNHYLRRVELDGTITTLAGGCEPGESGTSGEWGSEFACSHLTADGPAGTSLLRAMEGLSAVRGRVYVADGSRVRQYVASAESLGTLSGPGVREPGPPRWSAHYTYDGTDQSLDVYVDSLEETQIYYAGSKPYKIRVGLRSEIGDPMMWTLEGKYSVDGVASRPKLDAYAAISSMQCGEFSLAQPGEFLRMFGDANDARFTVNWYDPAKGLVRKRYVSHSCGAVRYEKDGAFIYEEIESATIPHVYPKQFGFYLPPIDDKTQGVIFTVDRQKD